MEHQETPLRDQKLDKLTSALLDARSQALAGMANGAHRMEPVAELDGVAWVNDSKATYLDATMETLYAITRPVIWMVEGVEHARSYPAALGMVKEKVKHMVVYGHKEEALTQAFEGAVDKLLFTGSVAEATYLAKELAGPGELVLFSPACPSGNGFANYEERGTEFRNAVKGL